LLNGKKEQCDNAGNSFFCPILVRLGRGFEHGSSKIQAVIAEAAGILRD